MKISICKNKLEIILDKGDEELSRRQIFMEIMHRVSRWLEWRPGA